MKRILRTKLREMPNLISIKNNEHFDDTVSKALYICKRKKQTNFLEFALQQLPYILKRTIIFYFVIVIFDIIVFSCLINTAESFPNVMNVILIFSAIMLVLPLVFSLDESVQFGMLETEMATYFSAYRLVLCKSLYLSSFGVIISVVLSVLATIFFNNYTAFEMYNIFWIFVPHLIASIGCVKIIAHNKGRPSILQCALFCLLTLMMFWSIYFKYRTFFATISENIYLIIFAVLALIYALQIMAIKKAFQAVALQI